VQHISIASGNPLTNGAIHDLMLLMFEATGIFTMACDMWHIKPLTNQTLIEFCEHFTNKIKNAFASSQPHNSVSTLPMSPWQSHSSISTLHLLPTVQMPPLEPARPCHQPQHQQLQKAHPMSSWTMASRCSTVDHMDLILIAPTPVPHAPILLMATAKQPLPQT